VFLAACVPGFAQWLNYPTPGIPRLPSGKPILKAPAPKTAHGRPDLSGLYDIENGGFFKTSPPISGPRTSRYSVGPRRSPSNANRICAKTTPIPIACHRACPGSTQATVRSRSFKLRDS